MCLTCPWLRSCAETALPFFGMSVPCLFCHTVYEAYAGTTANGFRPKNFKRYIVHIPPSSCSLGMLEHRFGEIVWTCDRARCLERSTPSDQVRHGNSILGHVSVSRTACSVKWSIFVDNGCASLACSVSQTKDGQPGSVGLLQNRGRPQRRG